MNHKHRRTQWTLLFAALFLVGLTSPALRADHHGKKKATGHNTLTAAEKKAGWTLLFDGKTLDGWNSWKTKKPLVADKGWGIHEEGLAIVKKGAGDIYTAKPYENYEFTVEWKSQGNSGILIRVDPKTKGPIYGVAPETQVLPDKPTSVSSTSSGGLYALYELTVKEKTIHPKGWNHVRIQLVDGHGIHWFNGQKVCEYKIGSDEWKKRLGKSKFKKKMDTFGMTKNGHIGFQDHGAKVAFRNIKIRKVESKNTGKKSAK